MMSELFILAVDKVGRKPRKILRDAIEASEPRQ
jgi:hypothetical protein